VGPRVAMAIDAGGIRGWLWLDLLLMKKIFPTQQNDFLLKGSERHFSHLHDIMFLLQKKKVHVTRK
jgi:hypothetical protein